MNTFKQLLFIFNILLIFHRCCSQNQQQNFPPGWTEKCIGCICEATSNCNQTIGCINEYCGMFLISPSYWVDAGRPIILGDNPNSKDAFKRCAVDSYCSSRAVNQYINKFIQDCNRDNVFSCDDYARLHYLGFSQCTRNIENEGYYRVFQKCFQENILVSQN